MAIQQKGTQGSSQSGSQDRTGTSGQGMAQGTGTPSQAPAGNASSSSMSSSQSTGSGTGTGRSDFGSSTGSTGSMSRGSSEHRDSTSGLMGQVRSSATDALGTVKSKASEKIEEQKHTLATGLTSVADNIRRLGSQVSTEPQTSENIAKYAGQYSETAAAKLEQAAHYFDEHDLNAIYHDVEKAARNNAAIFIGGAFAIGFLAARFLKSSRTGTSGSYGQQLYRGNGETGQRMETDVQSLGH
jgi:hypothetical protein